MIFHVTNTTFVFQYETINYYPLTRSNIVTKHFCFVFLNKTDSKSNKLKFIKMLQKFSRCDLNSDEFVQVV